MVSLAIALNSYIGYAKAAEIVQESTAMGQTIVDLARAKKEVVEILDAKRIMETQLPLKAERKRDAGTGDWEAGVTDRTADRFATLPRAGSKGSR